MADVGLSTAIDGLTERLLQQRAVNRTAIAECYRVYDVTVPMAWIERVLQAVHARDAQAAAQREVIVRPRIDLHMLAEDVRKLQDQVATLAQQREHGDWDGR